MKKTKLWIAWTGLFVLGLVLYFTGSPRNVTILIDGQPQTVLTRALTVGQALRAAGIEPKNDDQVQPPLSTLLGNNSTIQINRAAPVYLFIPTQGASYSFITTERAPLALLAKAGINAQPGDRLFWNGQEIPLDLPLPAAPAYTLQYLPATALTIAGGGQNQQILSSAATLGEALWQAGIKLSSADLLVPSPQTTLNNVKNVTFQRAVPITIKVDGQEIASHSAAPTVGQALAQAGIALQNLDYSLPSEDQPLPQDGIIQVVRVREEILLQQTPIPFESQFVETDQLALGERQVIEEGQPGLKVTRLRVRYEDNVEMARETEAEWVAKEPVVQKIGTGTKVVINTLDTPYGTLEYWRAITVYATSYSPCRSGTDRCYYGTSSGLPVKRGVIGVTKEWYRIMAGQRVYVPGYGIAVIADIGGGIPGKAWIDLGFSDDDFELWHQNVTLYFLTPVPANAGSYP